MLTRRERTACEQLTLRVQPLRRHLDITAALLTIEPPASTRVLTDRRNQRSVRLMTNGKDDPVLVSLCSCDHKGLRPANACVTPRQQKGELIRCRIDGQLSLLVAGSKWEGAALSAVLSERAPELVRASPVLMASKAT